MIAEKLKNLSGNLFNKFYFLVFFLFLASIFELLGIATIPLFLDFIINPGNNFVTQYWGSFGNNNFKFEVYHFSIFILLIFFVKNIFLSWIYYFEQNLLYLIKVQNAKKLFDYYIYSSLNFYKKKNSLSKHTISNNFSTSFSLLPLMF
tara:strand:+ start:3080 stop:3523 length:444 start_codon:yes stop_codon:yes gene_type:complete